MNNKPKIMLSVMLLFVLFGVVYEFYDMHMIMHENTIEIVVGDRDEYINFICGDNETVIVANFEIDYGGWEIQPDGKSKKCTHEYDHTPANTITDPLYINGTEITRLERIGDTANFTINNNLTLVYWDIVPHVIYEHEVQRYAIEYINTTTCDRNVMIGDRECVTTTSQKYHIFIHQEAYDGFDSAAVYMEHNGVIHIDMTKGKWVEMND